MPETLLSSSEVLLFGRELADLRFSHADDGEHPGAGRGSGHNKFLAEQLMKDARLARIYAFAFEGAFHELPVPAVFLVHGQGESAAKSTGPEGMDRTIENAPGQLQARAPNQPDLGGSAAADFQIADDVRVWPYDKGDYSIRMDVTNGQLEQILLDIFFEVEMPMLAGGRVAGGRVAGGRVAGGRVAGGRVAGGRVAGGRVGGGKGPGSTD
jgi:hypothetical protein